MLFVCHPKILHKHCLQFLSGVKVAQRETENNAYAKFWGDKQRALWYVMVFSAVVNWATRRIGLGFIRTMIIIIIITTIVINSLALLGQKRNYLVNRYSIMENTNLK